MDGKLILLIMSVVSVGMFVLPSTLAMYTGQHTFISGDNVQCEKCHGAIVLANGNAHSTFKCDDCHAEAFLGYDNSLNITNYLSDGNADKRVHAAAITINCIGCHSNPEYFYNYTTFNNGTKDGIVNVSYELEGTGSAHRYLNLNLTKNTGGFDDKDLVCVSCHTEVLVEVPSTEYVIGTIYLDNDGDANWMYDDYQSVKV